MGFWKPFQAPNPSAGEPSTPQATPHGAWRCSSVREKGEILQVIDFVDNFKNDRMNFGPELDTSVCEKREAEKFFTKLSTETRPLSRGPTDSIAARLGVHR
jgi:hypothetical protein